ncbi:hypothetical protein BST33_10830 [Mycolicibacter minnesotensis]|uniref:Uncharacterized protein n=1 Tax=Mycolicibacter minnesotensis TaxID=1118379 RepID=A0A7I7R8Q4_9MYCO|nr:PPE domain-containing protein [Mycolicibacter minnesotensis]ORB00813.1 hypothetical protein BST33_10830 [Mycolicibacter minnesotensis]BBY34477.1 PPE family protein [Mycolicibacter minnesotensis]
MNFAALPPEVNSGLMYTGAGSGPMLAAATAWSTLAAELHSAAAGYESVVAELTSAAWSGPSATAMVAAATPYTAWLNATAGQAEKAALQAKAAVAAYEAAFALTVPPPVIAANRARLLALLASNILGQNAAAIAATEAEYGEMWAQDATAMYSYSALSKTAAELEPFAPAPQTANPAGPLMQNGSSAANMAQMVASRLASAVPLAGSAESQAPMPALAGAIGLLGDSPPALFQWMGVIADETAIGIALPMSVLGVWLSGAAMYFSEQDSQEIFDTQDVLRAGQRNILGALDQLGAHAELPALDKLRIPHVPVVSAIGEAFPLGALSTPISWAEAAPEIRHMSYSSPLAAAPPTAGGLGTAFGQMALAGMGGSALAGAVNQRRSDSPAAPAAAAVTGATTSETSEQSAHKPGLTPLTSVVELAAGIRELGELHDAGYLTVEEFAEQKRRLLAR